MCEEMIADMLADGEINVVTSHSGSVRYPRPGQAAVTLPPITTFVSKKIKKMIEAEPKTTILKSEFVEPTASPDQFDGYDDHPRNVLAAHARAEVTHGNVEDTTGYVDDYTYENYSGDYYSSLTDDEDHIQYNK